MAEQLRVWVDLPVSCERLYSAWLDSQEHGSFSGGAAQIDPGVGGAFSAWDGYITGTTLEMEPYRRIVQAWRTSDFPEDAPDSRLEVLLEPAGENTRLTLVHDHIPAGQEQEYQQGWLDYYFEPMKDYFSA